MFNRSKDCGKCIKLRGTNGKGKWTIVKVVDECGERARLLRPPAGSALSAHAHAPAGPGCARLLCACLRSAAAVQRWPRRLTRRPPSPPSPRALSAASCRGDHDVDLSIPALKSSTGYRWDRKDVEWKFVSCSTGRKLLGDDGRVFRGTAGPMRGARDE